MNIAANKSPAVVIGEPKCMLAAVPAQATFIETPALRTQIQLAANHRASLSLSVLAPVPLAASATSAGSGSACPKRKSERLRKTST
jgi:hypothetical protein